MQKKRDDGIPVREACVKKWFLVMKLICVFTLFLFQKRCRIPLSMCLLPMF